MTCHKEKVTFEYLEEIKCGRKFPIIQILLTLDMKALDNDFNERIKCIGTFYCADGQD